MRQRVNVRHGANMVIHLGSDSSHLRIAVALRDDHILDRRLFDLPEVDLHDTLTFAVTDTFDNLF